MCFCNVIKRLFAFFLCIVLFISCNTTKNLTKEARYPVYVTNRSKVYPLPALNIEKDLDCIQSFKGEFGKNSFMALLYLTGDKNGFDITILNDLGITMGTLTYTDKELCLSSPLFPEELKAQYIIMDLQNVYYSFASLKKLYNSAGLDFTESIQKDGSIKRFITKKSIKKKDINDLSNIIEEINIKSNVITINNYYRNYKYVLSLMQ